MDRSDSTILSIRMLIVKRQRHPQKREFIVGQILQSEYPIQYVQVIDKEADMGVCFSGVDIITGEERTDWTKSAFWDFELLNEDKIK